MMMGAAQVAPAPLLCQLGDGCCSKDATRGKRLKGAPLTSWRASLRQDICAKCPALDEERRAVAEDSAPAPPAPTETATDGELAQALHDSGAHAQVSAT